MTIDLAGDAVVVASATGALYPTYLIAEAQSVATAAGALSNALALAADTAAQAGATGNLSVLIALGGAASAIASVTAALTQYSQLSGEASASASTTASMVSETVMTGSAAVSSTAAGSLSLLSNIAGAAAAIATAAGALDQGIAVAGAAQAVTTAAGNLLNAIAMQSAATAQASAAGTLSVAESITGGITYAVNLATNAVTTFSNFYFERLVAAHGKMYALSDGVLYRVGGDVDPGDAQIDSPVRFAQQSFGTNILKTLDKVYVQARSQDGLEVTPIYDEELGLVYTLDADDVASIRPRKIPIGRGNYWFTMGMLIQNRDGGQMAIGGIEVLINQNLRRVR